MLKKNKLRYNEYYDMQHIYDELYAQSKNGNNFYKLLEIIGSEQNICLAYRNLKSNSGSKTAGTDGMTIDAMAAAGSRLDQGGPGLIFIFLPNLFKSMPGSRILVSAFFVAVLFAGISSLINLFEAPIATMEQQLSMSRKTDVTAMVSAWFVAGGNAG